MTKANEPDLDWTMPVMRAGYAGRGLVYLTLAGFSLWAIWHGGQAEDTGTVLQSLEGSAWGTLVLGLIGIGLIAYAFWRVVDSIWDLEAYGNGGKGMIARAGMIVTGLVHGALGIAALAVLVGRDSGGGGGGGQSTIAEWTGKVMELPGGPLLVGLAGLATVGAGLYYAGKAVKASYRKHLRRNEFTENWNVVLQIGVAAQAVIILVIGGFLTFAGWRSDPGQAGGVGEVFDWLGSQPFGQFLVVLLCLGLLAAALFFFVNAAFRVIPKLADDGVPRLAEAFS